MHKRCFSIHARSPKTTCEKFYLNWKLFTRFDDEPSQKAPNNVLHSSLLYFEWNGVANEQRWLSAWIAHSRKKLLLPSRSHLELHSNGNWLPDLVIYAHQFFITLKMSINSSLRMIFSIKLNDFFHHVF